VLLQFGNVPAFLVANYALQRINAVPVPISPMDTAEDIHYIANDAGATRAVVAQAHADTYDDIDYLECITSPFGTDDYSADRAARGDADDAALLMYSSGTTGDPKGTLKTHEELLAAGEILRKAFDMQPADVLGGTAPASFAMGYLIFVLTPFRPGATISLLNTRDPATIADRIADDRMTIFSAVPTSYNKILKATEGEDLAFPALRICMTGGEELKRHTYDAWKNRFGLAIDNHYGCSELMTIALYQTAGMTPTYNGTPPDDMDVKLVDGDTESARANTTSQGELAVKAPVQVRYWNNTAAQEQSVDEGYFLLGDIFDYTDEDEYKFKCRKDNLIVTSGYKVSANEVENALLDHPYVEEAAVIGVPDDTRGQRIKAFVVADDGVRDPRGRGELQGYVKAKIAPYKYPRELAFVQDIPKTDVGKIDRNALKDRHHRTHDNS
jgi:2-aminobenzoate-CoA ligase